MKDRDVKEDSKKEKSNLTGILAGAVLTSIALLNSGCYEYASYHNTYRSYPQRQFYNSSPRIIVVPRQSNPHYHPRFNNPRPFNNGPYRSSPNHNHRPNQRTPQQRPRR
jgi:hypothetical protein